VPESMVAVITGGSGIEPLVVDSLIMATTQGGSQWGE